MSDVLQYKGYLGSVQYSREDKVLHGKLLGIGALVNYEAEDVRTLEKAFKEAVNDYLIFCEERGVKPEKPFNEVINYKPNPVRYQQAMSYAKEHDLSVKAVLDKALEEFLKQVA